MGLEEVVWCGVDWILVAWGRDMWMTLVNTLMKLRIA
jgi:hypothetical protein